MSAHVHYTPFHSTKQQRKMIKNPTYFRKCFLFLLENTATKKTKTTARASSVHLSSYRNTISNQSARVLGLFSNIKYKFWILIYDIFRVLAVVVAQNLPVATTTGRRGMHLPRRFYLFPSTCLLTTDNLPAC